jgi:CheY-like chemotaxis protein
MQVMPSILLVEDSQVDRVLAEGLLKRDRSLQVRTVVDGASALAEIERQRPDLIITDLHLPDFNGLELVARVRLAAPRVPVILVTAHGNETLAIQALEQGASSYVSKSQLSENLLSTVRGILELSQARENDERLTQAMEYAEFGFHLGPDPGPLKSLVDMLQQLVVRMNACNDGSQVRLGIALGEALQYMQWRGSFEFTPDEAQQVALRTERGQHLLEQRRREAPWAERKLHVKFRVTPSDVRIDLRHDGAVFDLPALPAADDGLHLDQAADRAVVLFSSLVQKVTFDAAARTLTLVYRK